MELKKILNFKNKYFIGFVAGWFVHFGYSYLIDLVNI